jgi:hypothetical protein
MLGNRGYRWIASSFDEACVRPSVFDRVFSPDTFGEYLLVQPRLPGETRAIRQGNGFSSSRNSAPSNNRWETKKRQSMIGVFLNASLLIQELVAAAIIASGAPRSHSGSEASEASVLV